MKGITLLATIGSAVGSMIVVLTLLWDIATTSALVAQDVKDTKQAVHELKQNATFYAEEIKDLQTVMKDVITVDYLGGSYVMVAVPVDDKTEHVKIPILIEDSTTNNITK